MVNCKICSSKCFWETNFTLKCTKCNYLFSNLKPGTGREILGIEDLRKKNFKKIILFLKKNYKKKLLNKTILEIGSGDGYFAELCLEKNLRIYPSEANKKDLKKSIKKSMPFKIGFWSDFNGFLKEKWRHVGIKI